MGLTPNPLCIIQARMGSTRLPGKMMLPVAGKPLLWWSWRRSIEAFGDANVVVAMPASKENDVLRAYCERIGARVFSWDGPESDVLSRLWNCAHTFRWHPDSIIVRVCGEDPLKDVKLMRAVVAGERHSVELSCEAVTLMYLDILHTQVDDLDHREHLSYILAPLPPPAPPPGVWGVDTEADLEAIKATMEGA